MKKFISILALTAVMCASQASAALIAEYNFDDSQANNSVDAAYDLAVQGSAPDLSTGAFYSDGNASNRLEVAGPGGMSDWTVSLWVYTETQMQGTFKGIFSNFDSPNTAYSWQIDSHDGDYRLLSKQNSNNALALGQAKLYQWQHIVVQKFGGNNARLYLDGSLVGTTGFNPGGLQNFRVGTNRNTNSAFAGFIDNIQIWNDSQVNANAVFQKGVGFTTVSAPHAVALLVLGFAGLVLSRKRMN
ncbi:LamG domain-containing protein [Alteromonas sediminis]|uniref:LamG domain-containing protein n=1 Tax=Alteromonas sediminis TaxID=2259342 RepID=A0A3N5XXV2_9ALTE|nr:LamG domain-containing protein [Alteromonas sediminis]RPJ65682.1 LamG domain-containing protein [Alteromonas sediminis]